MGQTISKDDGAANPRPLILTALLLLLLKTTEFVIDSQATFYADSAGFLRNAIGLHFLPRSPFLAIDFLWPTRSFVYGWMIRVFAIPFHSFRAIVALQMMLGAMTAWLLAYMLLRFFGVRPWLAVLSAVVFAVDPVQVVHEHMVMAETATLLATAIFLVAALFYLEAPSLRLTILLPLLGVLLISLRILYVPVIWAAAVLLPIAAYWPRRRRPTAWRPLLLALTLSCIANFALQWGFKHFTGRASGREAAYNYDSGDFLLATVSPLLEPRDAVPNQAVADIITAQRQSSLPLTMNWREQQLWLPGGLVANLRAYEHGDRHATNELDNGLAWAAILHHPRAFAALPFATYLDYWRHLPRLVPLMKVDDGAIVTDPIDQRDVDIIATAFGGYDIRSIDNVMTPSRTYHAAARAWVVLLLMTFPFLTGIAIWVSRENRLGAALLFVWSGVVLFASCMAVGAFYRLLHPFSLPALAANAIVVEGLLAWGFGRALSDERSDRIDAAQATFNPGQPRQSGS